MKASPARRIVIVTVFCATAAPSCLLADSFVGLGQAPPGSPYQAIGSAISGDGGTVTGVGWYFGPSATSWPFRWTPGDVEQLAGSDSGQFPLGISGDGAVVVGHVYVSPGGQQAWRWTPTGGVVGLGDLDGGPINSQARGVSADGTIVVGFGQSSTGIQAFRWTANDGMVALPDLPGGTLGGSAYGISADGSAIVGSSQGSNGLEATLWTSDGQPTGLGMLPGWSTSVARAASGDGAVVVGSGKNAAGHGEAFRWTSGGGMVSLGFLPTGGQTSRAHAVSGDGSVVVGEHWVDNVIEEAFIWTPGGGMQRLRDVLLAHGATSVAAWSLWTVNGISTDGHWVTGEGVNPQGVREGFYANVTPPTAPDYDGDGAADAADNCTLVANQDQYDADVDGYGNICDADLNNSGQVTTADYTILRNALNSANPVADLNGSGQVTSSDYTILRNRLNTAPGPSGLHP